MGHQHHLSKRKSYDRAVIVLKEQASRRKKIAIEYRLPDFDNVIKALNDAGIYVAFDKPTDTFNANYTRYLLGVEWSNKHAEYIKTNEPYPITLNWDYIDMTL